jgi:hypothetical protein
VNLFIDASVALAACGEASGSSRAVFDNAQANRWNLLVSPYVIREIVRNLPRVSPSAVLP